MENSELALSAANHQKQLLAVDSVECDIHVAGYKWHFKAIEPFKRDTGSILLQLVHNSFKINERDDKQACLRMKGKTNRLNAFIDLEFCIFLSFLFSLLVWFLDFDLTLLPFVFYFVKLLRSFFRVTTNHSGLRSLGIPLTISWSLVSSQ